MAIISRLLLSGLLLAVFALIGGIALDRADAERIAIMDEVEVRERFSQPWPVLASAAWYESIAERAVRMTPPFTPFAIEALERAVSLEPRNGETWARLSYARALDNSVDRSESAAALQQSYYRMPVAENDFRKWRSALANALWPYLSETGQAAIRREARFETADWVRDHVPAIYASLTTSS